MGAFILRRLLIAIPVLIAITLVAFIALSLAPGDPLLARLEPSQLAELERHPERLEERREELGLNDPFHERYLTWVIGVVTQADLGYSIKSRRPVVGEILARVPPTLALMSAVIVFAILVGVPLGILSAVRQRRRTDYALTGASLLLMSTPSFVLGLATLYVFGVWLKVLPTAGMQTLGEPFTIPDFVAHLILPALVLGTANAAELMRYTRASMLETLNREYLVTATAKGLPSRTILWRHAFRNSLIPILTIIGLLLPNLLAGAVITEQIFAWPGMGQLAVHAARDRDPAMMMGIVLVVGIAVVLANLLVDVLYARADPRIRYGGNA